MRFTILYYTTRHPPSSTLFPYTTLFRSVAAGPLLRHWEKPAPAIEAGGRLGNRREEAFSDDYRRHDAPGGGRHLLGRTLRGDRKSTRLNSSHPSISYAVFCLKKKIIEIK